MLNEHRYVTLSLELHLFFARIMKEHCIFLQTSLLSVNSDFIHQAKFLQRQFEMYIAKLLMDSRGYIGLDVIESGGLVTDDTLIAEYQTETYTGIVIDKTITNQAIKLHYVSKKSVSNALYQRIESINLEVATLIEDCINLKMAIHNAEKSSLLFSKMYPISITHMLEVGNKYKELLLQIEQGTDIENKISLQTLQFWNQNMQSYSKYIQGLLDPSEKSKIIAANSYYQSYMLLQRQLEDLETENQLTFLNELKYQTESFIKYNQILLIDIINKKVKSKLLPLQQDLLLREGYHYLRIINLVKKS